ncbi:protein-glutamine gamma-glutamyltransferase K-like isoform X1 [Acropora millepora]|uniref:protein-glutamine gamma-glutamyltransferase K-like isoform X1 n=1 Tax=Acropora millepora TaxID=45264 RepID=UPI001CF2D2E4|nr:protein-glutamine gamma-glutamyltransferase K-like isoform X1 [Acropora millepora]
MHEQTGCFGSFKRRRHMRVEPETSHTRGEQDGPVTSDESEPQPQPQPQPHPEMPPQPQPQPHPELPLQPQPQPHREMQPVTEPKPQPHPPRRVTDDTVHASDRELTSTTSNRSRLGEGEGRRNPVRDEDLRENLISLKPNARTIENGQAEELKTSAIDLFISENRKAHRTDDYDFQQLIIRRGQVFDVTVTFNRDYRPADDVILVQLATGKRPLESKGSLKRVTVQDSLTPMTWGMQIKENNGNTVRLSIMPAATAIIGQYEMSVETKSTDSSGEKFIHRFQHKEHLYILFNAWCTEDTVYMDSEEQRKEYVLEDFGYIWRGTSHWNRKLAWKFGQFDDVSLYSAFWLLDKAELPILARSNPIQISRTISAMANSNSSDGGVLAGRWSSTYPDGNNPLVWTGSTEILQQFWETKQTVKYGQCWVFSGLVTTLMRALGIPTRSVTNFDSAHDTDASMTIDLHFDEEGDVIDGMNDSVWNYHVWNESWFKRPDLPDGHDGWQAHDATPQELSAGVFRCGPASVKAVKNGEVYLPYDTGFVFAEVNGDRVYWTVKAGGSFTKTNMDKNAIGTFAYTKAVGSNSRDNVTSEYKYPEGTEEERQAVKFAFKYSSREEYKDDIYERPHVEDIHFDLKLEDTVYAGKSLDASVVVQSESEETREILVNLTAMLNFYTGVSAKRLKSKKLKFVLNSREEKRVPLTIEPDDYIAMLNACDSIKFYVKGKVTETNQSFSKQKDVEVEKPELQVTASVSQLSVGEDVTVAATFTNPLSIPLTSGQFHLEATRMKPKTMVVDLMGPAGANEEVTMDAVKFTSTMTGTHHVAISFQSNELTDIHGECTVTEPSS